MVRRPSPRLADGELTHPNRRPVDPDLALEQWRGYIAAFTDRGWAVTEVAPADEHPDGVFVEDTVVLFDDLAVLTSPGAASRPSFPRKVVTNNNSHRRVDVVGDHFSGRCARGKGQQRGDQ